MIDQHTSQTLEFNKVISGIREYCLTPYGHREVTSFVPMFNKKDIDVRQAEISQMKDLINFGNAFPLYRMDDCRDLLEKSRIEGTFLAPDEIRAVLELVEISIAIHGYDKEARENFPELTAYLVRMRAFPELKKEINRAIDEDGSVKDRASSALKHIRMDLADSKRKIISRLDSILSSSQKQPGWQDDVITQRNDRYVIPVLAGQYKADQGILHDRSQSGATLYVEPKETVELNNKVNMLMQEEQAEIVRILRALTAEIAQRCEPLLENTEIIGKLDAFHAAAGFANEIKANRPIVDCDARFELQEARHPLLIRQFKDIEKVIPLDLSLDSDHQAVLITGPNTGGKTIALKTVGLMVLMAQCGLPIPAKETSTIGIFSQVYADIGDEQSIELSLSTFSSHIRNITRAVSNVSDTALILLDEIGAGTDPKEGAALAESIILYMVEQGARLLSSTHYSQLKTLALDHQEIENASLEFDRETLAPTYRLQMGIPGSSYAVEIAGRLGMPKSICDHATSLLGTGERTLADLISSLETELAQVREDKVRLSERLARAEALEAIYKDKTDKLKEEIENTRTESLKETNELLETTRKETERLVAEIRKSQADGKSVKTIHHFLKDSQEKVKSVRQRADKKRDIQSDPASFRTGDSVRIISLNHEGEIDEIIGGQRARVRVGSVSTVVELRNLEKLQKRSAMAKRASAGSFPSTGEMSPEIHLRGMTGDEAMEAVDQFIDRAVVAGLHQIYVVHGKGTGALRRVLSTFLKEHREVDSLRLGNWNEGGAGVTIVKLK